MTKQECHAANAVCREIIANWEDKDGDYVVLSALLTTAIARALRVVKETNKCPA